MSGKASDDVRTEVTKKERKKRRFHSSNNRLRRGQSVKSSAIRCLNNKEGRNKKKNSRNNKTANNR